MDTRSIGALLLKVAGLVLIVISISKLPEYLPLMTRSPRGPNWSIWQTVGAAALSLGPLTILGVLLWLIPGTIANKIISRPSLSPASFDPRPIELIAITVLGLYLIARGLADVAHDAVFLVAISRQDLGGVLPASFIAQFGATLAELLIGVGLCIGARGVSRLIGRMRG